MKYPTMQQMLGEIEQRSIERSVDIVFVVETTTKMHDHIENIKDCILRVPHMLVDELHRNQKSIDNLRCKIIWFRDFYHDGEEAYGETKFFHFPQEEHEYIRSVEQLEAKGGSDHGSSGLEALTLARRSRFTQQGDVRRHIILFITDSNAYAFEDHARHVVEAVEQGFNLAMYPREMPETLYEFYEEWHPRALPLGYSGLNPCDRRLILIAPDLYPWYQLGIDFENCLLIPFDKCSDDFAGSIDSILTQGAI